MALWTVRAEYDAEEQVWYVGSSDIPGLAADDETLEGLAKKAGRHLPDLLELNEDLILDRSRLSGPHSIRVVAHHERYFPVAA